MKSDSLLVKQSGNLVYIQFPKLLKSKGVKHVFSTRHGGVSVGDCAAMNLSFSKDTDDNNVKKNFKILCAEVGINPENLVLSHQTHTNNVICVDESYRGTGINKPPFSDIDGLITNKSGVALVTQYADCTPLVFYDPEKRVIATAHAGWRGTVKLIGKCTVEKMVTEYGCNPEDIIAGIGPCIGKCCYEVDEPVAEELKKIDFLRLDNILFPKGNDKYMLDLAEANRQIMINSGINASNIDISDICTCCNSGDLHSHRATGGKRGNLALIIELE